MESFHTGAMNEQVVEMEEGRLISSYPLSENSNVSPSQVGLVGKFQSRWKRKLKRLCSEMKQEEEELRRRNEELVTEIDERKKKMRTELSEMQSKYDDLHSKLHTQDADSEDGSSMVKLNVGGDCFVTTVSSLTRVKPTYFSAMFSSEFRVDPNSDGEYFIDRGPEHFELILNFLRGNEEIELEDIRKEPWTSRDLRRLRDEVQFYGIEPLIEAVNGRLVAM